MGRKTWESLPKKFQPLPNRINIILSRNSEFINSMRNIRDGYQEGLLHYSSDDFTEVLSCLDPKADLQFPTDSIFVVGGGQLYQQTIHHPQCTGIYLTQVFSKNDIECDAFFPAIDPQEYTLDNEGPLQHEDIYSYQFLHFCRNSL
eukprot:Sdes_comp18237_c0_seq1m7838